MTLPTSVCEGGSNITDDGYCKSTASGPLCGVCRSGYYASSSSCHTCSGAWGSHSAILSIIVLLAACTPLFVYLLVQSFQFFDDVEARGLRTILKTWKVGKPRRRWMPGTAREPSL